MTQSNMSDKSARIAPSALAFLGRPLTVAIVGLAYVATFAACQPQEDYKTLVISPPTSTAAAGTTIQLNALGTTPQDEVENINGLVDWSSSDETIATISNDTLSPGLVTTLRTGTVTFTARASERLSTTATLTVTGARLVRLAVTPANASLTKGTSLQYTATGTFSDTTTQNLTESVNWSSSDSLRLNVSNSTGSKGQALGLQLGGYLITATDPSSGLSADTAVGVIAGPSPVVTWTQTAFVETAANNGTMAGTASATISGGQFVSGPYVNGTHFSTSNLPSGLSVAISTTSPTSIQVTLTGAAGTHAASQSRVAQLNLKPAAFVNATYPDNGTASTPLQITYINMSYFVLSSGRYTGNLGGLGGASDKCYQDLRTHNFKGKQGSFLPIDTVKAFLCSASDTCTNLKPSSPYAFAVSGDATLGGAVFYTNSIAQGPDDGGANWATSDHFGSAVEYWTGRAGGSTSPNRWFLDGSSINATGWTVSASSGGPGNTGEWGTSNSTTETRWTASATGTRFSATPLALICIVDY